MFLPALFTGIASALVARMLVPPRRTLSSRLAPYSVVALSSLGRPQARVDPGLGPLTGNTLSRLLGPPVQALASRLNRLVERGDDAGLLLRLRQANLLQDIPEADRASEYRIRQLASAAVGVGAGAGLGLVLFQSAAALGLAAIGFVAGAARWHGRVDTAIENRRQQTRIELYTVNQLLAMRTRTGGGVIQAVQLIAERGDGVVATDLRDAIRLHRGGLQASDAFRHLAAMSAEPYAARTYRLLAAAEDRGTDLGRALLALSSEVREARRDTLRRQAARRRAAMLIPIIGLMAPVMLLFIIAPVAELLFGIAR